MKNRLIIITTALAFALLISSWTEGLSENLIRKTYKLISNFDNDDRTTISYDENGIPVVDYGTINNFQIGKQYNPVTVCQTALRYWEKIDTDSSSSTEFSKFLNCANWIVENIETRNDFAVLPYSFPWPKYFLDSGWVSAMANGQALQVLIRAHKISGDQKYLSTAMQLKNSFLVEVSKGGVTHKTENGRWYAEYASASQIETRPMVLNGMMYALIGLHEYKEYLKDYSVDTIFSMGIKTLADSLFLYDRNGHSYYDRLGNPSGGQYHKIHIELLLKLYEISKQPELKKYQARWSNFQQSSFVARLLKAPTKIAVAILILNFVMIYFFLEACLHLQRKRLKRR